MPDTTPTLREQDDAYLDEFRAADDRMRDAAGEMLDALREMLALHVAHHNHMVHAAARAAIARATGAKP